MHRRTRDSGGEGDSDPGRIEATAVRLLARREHSTEELKRKLRSRGYDADVVAAVVEKLGSKRLVSDDRFTASRLRHHSGRGQGPVRIRADLRQQGIADDMIETQFSNTEVDWNRLAADVRRRRFGDAPPGSLSERAKQARFLQYRGFTADQIRAAFGDGRSDERLAISDESD